MAQEGVLKKAQEGVFKKAEAEVTSQVQPTAGPYLLVTIPPQGPYPVRDLRDHGPSEHKAIWRTKLREFKAQKTAQKKRGWAMEKRLEDEGGD